MQPTFKSDELPPVVETSLAQPLKVETSAAHPQPPQAQGIKHNRPLIFAILFGVTGVLGLPLLWSSPVFTRSEKWWWSLATTVYTLALVGIAGASLMVILRAWDELTR